MKSNAPKLEAPNYNSGANSRAVEPSPVPKVKGDLHDMDGAVGSMDPIRDIESV